MSDERDVIRADLNAIQAHAVSATEQLNHLPPNVGYVTVNAEGVPEIADKLRALESQSQALQERIEELTRDNYRIHLLYEITPPEKNALERIDALQERAEKAEALLHRIMDEGLYEDATHVLIEVYFASQPTQGTDA